jgi:hypothetical protein
MLRATVAALLLCSLSIHAADHPATTRAAQPIRSSTDLPNHVGKIVEIEGLAGDAKLGPVVILDDHTPIYLDGHPRWPKETLKTTVRLRGTLIKHAGLHNPTVGGVQSDYYSLRDAKAAASQPATAPTNRVSFLGLSDSGLRIVYVCSASGSMVGTVDTLRVALRKSIADLRAPQSFNLVILAGRPIYVLNREGPVEASPAATQRAADFLDRLAPSGEERFPEALDLAFQQKPDVIYLLTDGDFTDNQAVTDLCKKLNSDKKVKINTILFVAGKQSLNEELSFVPILKTIASDSGGHFTTIDATTDSPDSK